MKGMLLQFTGSAAAAAAVRRALAPNISRKNNRICLPNAGLQLPALAVN